MEEGYVSINQVPTRLISVGGWIDKPLENRHLILVIPGNPGLIGYYETFINSLYDALGGEYVIWGIGHGGHEVPPGVKLPSVSDHPDLFTLNGQVMHKLSFIETHVPKGVKVHLVGHSIGAKICLELVVKLSADSSERKASAYLLFPTLERIAQTPNGRKLWPILGPLRRPVVMAASAIQYLPESWLTFIVRWFLAGKGGQLAVEESPSTNSPSKVHVNVRTTLRLLNPQALERTLFMAHDEMQVVGALDVDSIRQHSDKLVLYFGTKDQWCPLEYARNLQSQVPEVKTVICSHGFEHAFVLQSSQQMALIVSQWIKEHS